MALANTLGSVFSLSFRDNNGKNSSMQFYLPAAANTLTLALERANAIRDAAAALTNARITGGNVSFVLNEDDPGTSVPESEVERKLIFPFVGANIRQRYTAELPSPLFTLEQPLTDAVMQTDPAVLAFINAVIANATTNRGETLSNIDRAVYVDHRNRRRS